MVVDWALTGTRMSWYPAPSNLTALAPVRTVVVSFSGRARPSTAPRSGTIGFGGVARHIVSGASDADAIAAEDAALAIIADLETAVRTDATLAGLGFQVEFTGPLESEVLAADAQRVAVATFTVVVRTVL